MCLPTFQGHDLLAKVYFPDILYHRLKNTFIFVPDTSFKTSEKLIFISKPAKTSLLNYVPVASSCLRA